MRGPRPRGVAWIDAELATSGSDGAVSLMLALSDMDGGMPFHAVIGELLIWSERAGCARHAEPAAAR